jgi:Uma2 family endonuclease
MVFVPREELHRIGEQSIDGPPALVVEILSPTNAYYDLVHKKDVYESSGVKEYWIVDPTEKTIEVLQNSPQGFIRFAKARQAGSVGSHVLQGFTVSLEEIFEGM